MQHSVSFYLTFFQYIDLAITMYNYVVTRSRMRLDSTNQTYVLPVNFYSRCEIEILYSGSFISMLLLVGLDNIHQLTNSGVRALFQITDWNGTVKSAEYSHFKVDSEATNYTLSISGHSGDLCDAMNYHNSYQFHSRDQ